jgi:hypothetical protein
MKTLCKDARAKLIFGAGVLSGVQAMLMLLIDRAIDTLCKKRIRQPRLTMVQLAEPEQEMASIDAPQQPTVVTNPLSSPQR